MDRTIIRDLLKSNGYLIINKSLAHDIGLNETILLADLFSKEEYFENQELLNDGYFYNTRDDIEKNTTLTAFQQRQAEKHLIKLGFIETKQMGLPNRTHYKVVYNKLCNHLTTSCKETSQLDVKKLHTNNNKRIIINKKEINKEKSKKHSYNAEELTDSVCEDIAKQYSVDISYIKKKRETLKLYCESTGTKYANYKSTLMNWVRRDLDEGKVKQVVKYKDKYANLEISEEQRQKNLAKLDEVKKEVYSKIGRKI